MIIALSTQLRGEGYYGSIFYNIQKQTMKAKLKPFVGKWIIVEMQAWDQDVVNMEVPGHFTFRKDGTGHFQFGLAHGKMDCRMEDAAGKTRIEFSWEGQDELDPAMGRGWALIENEELQGRIFSTWEMIPHSEL